MLGTIVVVVVVTTLVLFFHKHLTFSNIPGRSGLPIIGVTPWFLLQALRGRHLGFILSQFEELGGTFYVNMLGLRRIVFISELEDVKCFLHNSNTFQKGHDSNQIFRDIFGEGIFNSDGENWHVQRQYASSLFHFNNVPEFVKVFDTRARLLNSILSKHSDSHSPINIQELFMSELGYGININALGENKDALAVCASFDYVQAVTNLRFYLHPFWKLFSRRNFEPHLNILDCFMKNIIDERKREIAKGVDISDRHDLLTRFLSANDIEGKPMFDDKYLLEVLKNFLIAGRDTTALALTWTLFLLAQHPEVEQRLLNEIDGVVDMKQVIDESLRLYPSVPVNARIPNVTTTLPSGHIVPAGTMVVYSPYAIHRLPQYWSDPHSFNPDRWVTDDIKAFQFVPFHGGPRICLGQNMAYIEMKVVLCSMLPLFKFKLVDPSKVNYTVSLTLHTKCGVDMFVIPRK